MDATTAIRNLVDSLGGQAHAAAALGVKQPTISNWVNGKHGMSPIVAMRAEKITGGEFSAAELCPELQGVMPAA